MTDKNRKDQQKYHKHPEDPDHPSLRIRARDHKDVEVVSALLQDAIVNPSGMHYSPEEELFSVLANRFCWEHDPIPHPDGDLHKRTHTGVHFSHVHEVKHRGMDQKNLSAVHSLIGLKLDRDSQNITLMFADGAEIRLSFRELLLHVTDLSEHWYTHHKPEHGHEEDDDIAPSSTGD